MRNFRVMLLAPLMVLALAATASAQADGFYLTPKFGYSHLKSSTDSNILNSDGTLYRHLPTNGKHSGGQPVLALALGYDFNSIYDVPIRTEFEYAWRGKSEKFNKMFNVPELGEHVEIGRAGAHSFFFNGYLDFHNDSPVTPYIGAGLGFAVASIDHTLAGANLRGNVKKTDTNFAWNVGGGAAWNITDKVALDLGYRYADFGNVSHSRVIAGPAHEPIPNAIYDVKSDLTTHEVLLGVRIGF